jgi:hypothetical protein
MTKRSVAKVAAGALLVASGVVASATPAMAADSGWNGTRVSGTSDSGWNGTKVTKLTKVKRTVKKDSDSGWNGTRVANTSDSGWNGT